MASKKAKASRPVVFAKEVPSADEVSGPVATIQ